MQVHLIFRIMGLFLCLLACPASYGQTTQPDLTKLNLVDLMNIEVTSVAKKEQKMSQTASAVFVITQDDIRHSGATNIPDLLRMVPGLDVAQINSSTWAISARGFNGEFSNKLLVMLDGRSVYLPTFSGVFWDVLDVPLEDIERIEVIRGPGATSWGANAVNGVVNIMTHKAAATSGGMVVAGGGDLDQGFGTLQYGGNLGTATNYRFFGKYRNIAHLPGLAVSNGQDAWHILRGGFRADSRLSGRDDLSVQGDLYSGREHQLYHSALSIANPEIQVFPESSSLWGGYVQTEWNHHHSYRSNTTLKGSFDHCYRGDSLGESRSTLNLDFEHHFTWSERQDFVWGVGYRESSSNTTGDFAIHLEPGDLATQLFSSFVQDEIVLAPNRLTLTVGGKLERNHYTGFGVMPSARLAWNVHQNAMAWMAVSRAIRTPSNVDTSMIANAEGFIGPGGLPSVVRILGNPRYQNENLLAYEAGYRTQVAERLSVDFAAYYNSYDQLGTIENSVPFVETDPSPLHLVIPMVEKNLMHGQTDGFEVSANWKLSDRWSLVSGYSFEQIHMHLAPSSQDTQSLASTVGGTPRNWGRLASRLRIGHRLVWDASATFVDRLVKQNVPSHTRIDTQLTWPLTEKLSLSLVGQNLLQEPHLEFNAGAFFTESSMIKRSAHAKINWQF